MPELNLSETDTETVIAEKKNASLELLFDAWEEATAQGIEQEIFAHAALFTALSELIHIYGEDAVANMAARLPTRVQDGEFTLDRVIQ